MKFEKGDIVVFKEEHESHFTSGIYLHKVGVKYIIIEIGGYDTMSIKDIHSNVSYFAFGDMINKLITLDEWREIKLDKLFG
jgi:hypothetical protein